jgi:hypothetical protein
VSAKHTQAFVALHVATTTTTRRRSTPTRPTMPEWTSVNQQSRERPRCSAVPLTPGCRDGVVHAIVGRCPKSMSACPVRAGETRRPHAHVRAQNRRITWPTIARRSVRVRVHVRAVCTSWSCVRIGPTTIASMILAPCSASSMLCASLRPGRWPGLRALTTPPRGTDWQLRDGGQLMRAHNGVDARNHPGVCWRHHVSAARHSSGSPQRFPERVFGRQPQGTVRTHPSPHRSRVA